MTEGNEFIPYGSQQIDGEDIEAVCDVLRGPWLTTGPCVEEFERTLADRCGAAEAVAVNSGTAALHAAYYACGVGEGTQVVVPALTFSATANAAVQLGATVRVADVDERTLTMDPESLQQVITDDTAVVAPVDFAGHPADLRAIRAVADGVGAAVVQDAAHSLGAVYRGQPVGSIADVTTFSFHPVKTITTGEGGAAVTDFEAITESMRRFRNHGMQRSVGQLEGSDAGEWLYDIDEIGLNYRITDVQCALGTSQLDKLDRFIHRRRQIAAQYLDLLDDVEGIELPADEPWCEHAWHLFVIRVDQGRRKEVFEALRARNIGVQVHYIPVNMLTAYRRRGHHPEQTPVALRNYRQVISIPCFPKMRDRDVERVAAAVRDVVEEVG